MKAVALIAAVAVMGAAHGPALYDEVLRGGPRALWAIAAFVIVAGFLAHALAWTLHTVRTREDRDARRSSLLWLAMVAVAVAAWPDALYPTARPLHSLPFAIVLAAFPAALTERAPSNMGRRRAAEGWRRALVFLVLAGGAALVVRDVLSARSSIEGADFYLYSSFARDLQNGATDVHWVHFRYFPGVYTFWRTAIAVGGDSLEALQWSYLTLLAANALAVAGVVWRVSRTIPAAALGALGYLMVISRLEGFHGLTEPLATLPVLVALLVWGGRPLAGLGGTAQAVALGIGLGLGVYAKQQGVLLSAGWIALIVGRVLDRSTSRDSWRLLAAIPVVAISVFLLSVLGERQGLEPLRIALDAAATYESEGRTIDNLAWLAGVCRPWAAVTLLAIGVWLAVAAVPRLQGALPDPAWRVVGFAACATIGALLQFTKRSYLHYGLLVAPFAVVLVVVAGRALGRRVLEDQQRYPLAAMLVLGLAVVLLARDEGRPGGIALWPPTPGPNIVAPSPWRAKPEVARDITVLRGLVRRNEDVLVLPPRRNELHLLLGTRPITHWQGYGWAPVKDGAIAAIRSPKLESVVLIRDPLTADDWRGWEWARGDEAVVELQRAGFVPVRRLETMSLWRRPYRHYRSGTT